MFNNDYTSLPMFTSVYSCLPMFSHVYLCLALFTLVCFPVYPSLLVFTYVTRFWKMGLMAAKKKIELW